VSVDIEIVKLVEQLGGVASIGFAFAVEHFGRHHMSLHSDLPQLTMKPVAKAAGFFHQHDVKVSTQPVSNSYLASGVAPVPAMLTARTADKLEAAASSIGARWAAADSADPDAFAAFLSEQPDLGTKWAPRFVRVTGSIPLTPTNKVFKSPLRNEGWLTADPVWWRNGREPTYFPLGEDDRRRLAEELDRHGRTNLMPGASV